MLNYRLGTFSEDYWPVVQNIGFFPITFSNYNDEWAKINFDTLTLGTIKASQVVVLNEDM